MRRELPRERRTPIGWIKLFCTLHESQGPIKMFLPSLKSLLRYIRMLFLNLSRRAAENMLMGWEIARFPRANV